jgi:hypothetical protein
MGAVAGRAGRADGDALLGPVHTQTQEDEDSRRQPTLLESGDEPPHQLSKRLLDRFGAGDRLGEAELGLGRILGHDRIDRLGRAPQSLVEAQEQRPAEAALERPARHRHQVADPLDAEPAGGAEHIFIDLRLAIVSPDSASASPPGGHKVRDEKRASACAAPGVPATAMRAVKPSRAQKRTMRRHIVSSPPNRCATPVRSSHSPSAPETAAPGVQRLAANRASRPRKAASASGSDSRSSSPGTIARA